MLPFVVGLQLGQLNRSKNMYQNLLSNTLVSAEGTYTTRSVAVHGFPARARLTHSVHIEYHWQELWRALVLLLDFLASKLDILLTTGGVELLVNEVRNMIVSINAVSPLP